MAVNSKQSEWSDIPSLGGRFEASRSGEIRNKKTGKIRHPYLNSSGYCVIGIYDRARKQTVAHRVHRLVAEAFIPNPDNKPQINHIDGNKRNNAVANLEWCTAQENHLHARRLKLIYMTEKRRMAAAQNMKKNRLLAKTKKKCTLIDSVGHTMEFPSIRSAAIYVEGFPSAITRCCQGKAKTYKGFTWRYCDGD